MSMTAHITYRSLYAITERRPEFQSLSLLADFGVAVGPAAGLALGLANGTGMSSAAPPPGPCPIVLMAGPDSEDATAADGIRPRWWL